LMLKRDTGAQMNRRGRRRIGRIGVTNVTCKDFSCHIPSWVAA
jgi:hypothetical protein